MFSLQGKVALVTGGGRGLGFGMSAALAEAGAHVVLNGRNEEQLKAAEQKLKDKGLACSVMAFDVTNEDSVKEAVAAIVKQHNRLDILVNNAGINDRREFLNTGLDDWNKVININLNGPFLLSRECARVMKDNGGGRIINVASVLSKWGRATIQAYTASKHAIVGMTRGLAAELGPMGITVNALGPGYMATEMTEPLQQQPNWDKLVTKRTPVGRWGLPEDMAGPVVFLASDASKYVNGQLIMVDGGMTDCLMPEF